MTVTGVVADAFSSAAARSTTTLLAALGDPAGLVATIGNARDPERVHTRLRRRGPLLRSLNGVYVATTHSLCNEVLRHPDIGVRCADGSHPSPSRFNSAENSLTPSFLELDEPEHARLRRLAAPAFRPAIIRGYAPTIEATAHRLAADCAARGDFDVIADFAAPLPIAVISDLLDIPIADREHFAQIGNVIGASLDGVQSRRQADRVQAATATLDALFDRLADQRRRDPGVDVISRLVTAHDGGDITGADLRATCTLLLIAGFETTVNLIGNAVAALHDGDDESWQRLVEQPDLAEAAIEETLRYAPPVRFTSRITHQRLTLAGRDIPAGATIFLDLAAANRDARVFDDPDRFRLDRGQDVDHLAFSSGIHYCLGAGLARIEGAIALRALTGHFPLLRLQAATRRRGVTIAGYAELLVDSRRFTSRARARSIDQ